jgi:hypothetical protein
MRHGVFPTRRMASLMRGPLVALPQRSALVVVIGLLLVALAARGAFANAPPIADAGPDQTVGLGEAVMLTGHAEGPDGDPIVCWDWAIDLAPEGDGVKPKRECDRLALSRHAQPASHVGAQTKEGR